MSTPSAVPLLTEWERFCAEHPQGDLREFATWLLTHLDPLRTSPPAPAAEAQLQAGQRVLEAYTLDDDFLAWFFAGRLTRYVRFYTKPIMAEHGFAGPDEFLFLALIGEMDRPTKKEVCAANVTDLTTGMDILRRLQRQGLIQDAPDERDARAKRLSLTEPGQQVLRRVYEQLEQMPQVVLADLDAADRQQLLRLLRYLNNYHFQFYRP